MPYNERTPGGDTASSGLQSSHCLALAVLAALAFLVVVRFAYGAISIEAGVK